ncbi:MULTISPECIES: ATP-grasp domain-containing protein [unclassified Streptomyces]|uniref:ATP-grasp domain-containing protein n=2 Tax=Streptomyces TaxID=1883 RepID=A0AAU1I010_9ACTN|nr:ATP-grasp domain-containing protein [Streptomyces sp. NBC_01017]
MRIAVLIGGPSPEGEGSYTSGEPAAKALSDLGHSVDLLDMLDVEFWKKLPDYEAAFIAGHGWYAEDGKLQGMLEMLRFPYTGSGVLASALGMHKPTFKQLMAAHGIPTLPSAVLRRGMSNTEIRQTLSALEFPLFVKPASSGDSFEAGIVRSVEDVARLLNGEGKYVSQDYLAEPYLSTNTMTVGVLEIDGEVRALPVLEAVSKNEFYDNEAKNDPNLTEYKCPAPVPDELSERMRSIALRVFELCGCYGVGRVDFMMSQDGPVVLELNTVPGMALTGNLATMANADGISYEGMIGAILSSGMKRPAVYHP